MALIIKDRVRETTTSIGTGGIVLGGAVTGYQAFSSVMGNGDTTYYTIANSYQWEVGLGTYNSSNNILARTQVLASSNNGDYVNFDTGTKDIFIDYPASTAVYKTTAGRVSLGSIFTNYNPQLRALYLDGANGTQLGFGINNNEYSFILANPLYTTLTTSGATSIKLATNNLNRLIIDSAGRASLGYDPPPSQYAFTIVSNTAIGSSNGVYIANSSYDTGLSLAGGNVAGSLLTSANGIELSSTSAAKSLLFKTVSTERMRIDASGNVGIGNTPSGSYKLEVTGGVGAGNFAPTSSVLPINGMYLVTTNVLGFSTNSTSRLVIGATGDATFSGAVSAASVTATGNATAAALIPSGTTVPANGMYLVSAAPPILGFSVGSALCGSINTTGTFTTGGSGLVDAYGYTLRSYSSAPPTYGITSPGGTSLSFAANSAYRMTITSTGNIYGTSGTTAMTDGFFYIPAAAGAPSGTPTAVSGTVPMYYDTTNNQFYVYNGAWKKVALT